MGLRAAGSRSGLPVPLRPGIISPSPAPWDSAAVPGRVDRRRVDHSRLSAAGSPTPPAGAEHDRRTGPGTHTLAAAERLLLRADSSRPERFFDIEPSPES
jgi:hypothetical protein